MEEPDEDSITERFRALLDKIREISDVDEDEPEEEFEVKVVGMIAKDADSEQFKFIIDRDRVRVTRAQSVHCTLAGLWEDNEAGQTSAMAIIFDTDDPSPLKNNGRELIVVLDEAMPSALYTVLANLLPRHEADAMSQMIVSMYNANMAAGVYPAVAELAMVGERLDVIDGWDGVEGHATVALVDPEGELHYKKPL